MATTTPNIGLTLPSGTEQITRQVLNDDFTLIDTAVGTLNSNLIWTVAGSIVGTNTITVPATWGEIDIAVLIEDNPQRVFTFSMPRGSIGVDNYVLRDGYYANENNYAYVAVNFKFNNDLSVTISLSTCILSGTEYKASSRLIVEYRNKP